MFFVFQRSLPAIVRSFEKTVQRLEAFAEKQLTKADNLRAEAAQLRIKAKEVDRNADALVDEAGKAVRISSRITQLLD